MSPLPITDRFAVAGQLTLEAIEALAASGTRCLVNNRPDGEEPGQPGSAAEAAAAARAGLAYRHQPIDGAAISRADVERLQQTVREADGPVVAHCRSGTRSLTLWVIGEVLEGRLDPADILAFGAERGFDLAGAVRWLDANGGA